MWRRISEHDSSINGTAVKRSFSTLLPHALAYTLATDLNVARRLYFTAYNSLHKFRRRHGDYLLEYIANFSDLALRNVNGKQLVNRY
jgi:hypothetical protein